MTDAIITPFQAKKPKLKGAERSNDEKAYGFWIYLMSDAIIFTLLLRNVTLCGDAALEAFADQLGG